MVLHMFLQKDLCDICSFVHCHGSDKHAYFVQRLTITMTALELPLVSGKDTMNRNVNPYAPTKPEMSTHLPLGISKDWSDSGG